MKSTRLRLGDTELCNRRPVYRQSVIKTVSHQLFQPVLNLRFLFRSPRAAAIDLQRSANVGYMARKRIADAQRARWAKVRAKKEK
jgi:hypothetical protein